MKSKKRDIYVVSFLYNDCFILGKTNKLMIKNTDIKIMYTKINVFVKDKLLYNSAEVVELLIFNPIIVEIIVFGCCVNSA